ncbi:LacI family DNA-binding transcriptional regulator [Paracoccaceae bacterium Fryx2]|nr:LacI family DNA-binding transcriptional regulator [Paracoccaceae bacterium Fryx2]
MRPTVNDIAREAGVSLATVDRVLNARPGVRDKTIRAVQDAIARLGYVRDVAAANLARQRTYRLAFVLPDTESQFVGTLVSALHAARPMAASLRSEVQLCRFPAEDPHALAHLLAELAAQGVAGVALMAPETPILRDAIRALRQRGVAVVALVSDLPNTERDHFVGIDNRAAGRTAAVLMGRFLRAGPARVIVLAQSMLLRESNERRLGFDEVMLRDFPQVTALPTLESHGSARILGQAITETLRHTPEVGGIYLLGSGHRYLSQALRDRGLAGRLVVIGHELTPHVRAALEAGSMDAVITQNVGHLVRSALRVLRGKIDHSPIDAGQEQIRIEVVLRENLPALADDTEDDIREAS